jgi:class 3 adenylate cyclase/tetratricopeptide (TPR) repeat protein
MVACGGCGTESPDGFRFCPVCGLPLADAADASVTEERRVVTALFCDLVGFTATSETADPEDVDRMLSGYAALARREIERHGGVVEKFIGDAVVGVFGIPVTHEDDALRAVRAGLDICTKAADLEGLGGAAVRLRVGVNTGEVLARMSVETGSGERFLAGDAVNTASRIQSAAPEMGVAVGMATYQATRGAVEYRELDPVALKGKAEPVRIFHAASTKARTGVDLTRPEAATYVGRADELTQLTQLFETTGGETPVRLVTIIGEAGMGKSRMVAELRAHVGRRGGPVTWRQGRCLPYGEGITFWALGEVVKAQGGILESDSPADAEAKLDGIVPPGPDRAWMRERLLPLIGLESTSANRDESFSAWLLFLEGLAADHPAVVVIEDLHWADEAMLSFLEHVAQEGAHGPLFVLATARPDLLTKHPDFAAELPNAHRFELTPLSTDETASLVTSLLGAVVPANLSGPIIERADGNPLYAEEYVALLRDRDLLDQSNGTVTLRTGADLPVPESIHALLAARLDTLPADRKSLLTDAAVVGKVFWDGPLVAMGARDPGEVAGALAELAQLGFLRPAAQSSMAGEREYAFWHVLGRDVAYRQLPRGSRADRHAAAAIWLEAKMGERIDDIADVLADHWGTALELSRAAGQEERARQAEPKAIDFLVRAGDRAMGLDMGAAVSRFEAAKDLATPGHPQRPDILLRFGETAPYVSRPDEAVAALDEALEVLETGDDWEAKGRALWLKARALWERGESGDNDVARQRIEDAVTLLQAHPPTPALVDALTELGVDQFYGPEGVEAIETLDRAMDIAKELGLPTPGRALGFRGRARMTKGDTGGMDDFRQSIALCAAAGQGRDVAINTVNMGVWVGLYEGPAAGIVIFREAIDHAARFGYRRLAEDMTLLSLQVLVDAGAYDEALEIFHRLNVPGHPVMRQTYGAECRIYALRGRREEALAGAAELEKVASERSPEGQAVSRAIAATIRAICGDLAPACRLIEDAWAYPDAPAADEMISNYLPDMVRCACDAGRLELAERIVRDAQPRFPYAAHALVGARARIAEAHGQFEEALAGHRDAASRWAAFAMSLEEGHAHLGEARCLLALGRQDDARAPLTQARGIFETLGAAVPLAQVAAVEARALTPTTSSG